MRGGGVSRSKAERGQPDLPVSRLLLRTGRPVTPPTDWWRTTVSDGGCKIVASSDAAKGTSTSQAAAPTPSNVNSHSKRRRKSCPEGEPRHLKSARSDSRGPGDTYSFPADLSDANASRRTPLASPTSTKRGGVAPMGPHMGSAVEDIPQRRSTGVPTLPASMEGTSKGHHRHSGLPPARPPAMPASMEPSATCPTRPRDSRTSAQGQLSNSTCPTPHTGVSRKARDGNDSRGGAGEQPPAECPAARVLRTGRVSQVPTPWWVGSAVPFSAAACPALPLRSPSSRQGTTSSRLASISREDSQRHPGPSPADLLPGQTGKPSTRQALFRATPGKERPSSRGHRASPPQKRRQLLRQPIANIVRRVECGLPRAQLPPPREATLGDGALLLEAASRGQAGIQELPQQLVFCEPDACPAETPLMLVSTAHAVFCPPHALPADALGGPATGVCHRSASRAGASLSREPQMKGPPCLRPQPSWQSGVSGGTSSACLHPVSPPAGQGMRRASASRSSLDRMATQDSVGADVAPSLSGSVQSGEHVSDKRPRPPDCPHVPPEGRRASPLLDTSAVCALPGDGEGGSEHHMEARTRDRAANEELTGGSSGPVPEQCVIARGGTGLPQGQTTGGEEEMGIVLASASPHTIASRQDQGRTLQQAQQEDSALQVERTASPPTFRHSVTSTTSTGAPVASGSTSLCRNCNPPSSFLPCVSCMTEAAHPGGRSVRRCSAPGPAANSDLCDVTARSVSPERPSEAVTASQGRVGLKREVNAQPGGKRRVRALCAGAQDPSAPTPSPAANHMVHSKGASPGSPDLQYRSPAFTNQANALSGPLSAAQRLRNLNRLSGNVPGDEGDRDDPSTSSISIGGTPVRDLQACATSCEPSQVDREPLEHLDGVEALAAQLTPSAFQFLQKTLAEVEAL